MALIDEVSGEYDVARKRAAQRETGQVQAQKQALSRRAAALGNGPSGAFIKQEQVVQDQSAERLANANEGIDAAQHQEVRRLREINEGRDFAKSEREASQGFAAEQAKQAQAWQSRESALGRNFSAEQNRLARGIQESQFAKQMERDLLKFKHEVDVDKFNMDLATKMSNEKDVLEKLFSSFTGGALNTPGGRRDFGIGVVTGAPTGAIKALGGKF